MQNMQLRRGYIACTVGVTTTAASLKTLIENLLSMTAGQLGGSFREVQLQVDPEGTAGSIRVGDASLGQTVGGQVQKGVTLSQGGADTYRAGGVNDVYLISIFVQAVTGTPSLNVQLWEM